MVSYYHSGFVSQKSFQVVNCVVVRTVCVCVCVCKCVLYYCHQVSTKLQLTNISYHIKIGDYASSSVYISVIKSVFPVFWKDEQCMLQALR